MHLYELLFVICLLVSISLPKSVSIDQYCCFVSSLLLYSSEMANPQNVELEAAKFLHKLIQESKDEPTKLATKLYVVYMTSFPWILLVCPINL